MADRTAPVWSAIMVHVLPVDGPHVRILPMADETNAGKKH